jgi:hypothetical protein
MFACIALVFGIWRSGHELALLAVGLASVWILDIKSARVQLCT